MLSSVLYEQFPSRPTINRFSSSAPDIVGVGGASAEVRGYVDVPLQIAEVEIAHPLLVVTDLSFPLLIGMDLLQPHSAKMSLGHAAPLELSVRVCDMCLKNVLTRNPHTAVALQSRVYLSLQYSPRIPLLSSQFSCRAHNWNTRPLQ